MMQSTEIVELSSAPRVAESTQSEVRLVRTRSRRTKRLLLLSLVLLLLSPSAYICWQARDGSQLGYFQDDGLYLTAAKSLVEKGRYIIPSLPGQPYQTKYPPLYPLLLAAVWKLSPAFPANLKWFVLLNWCLWAAFLAVAFAAFRCWRLSWAARWGALILLASNAACLFLTINLMSEALFSTFVLVAILLAERASRTSKRVVTIAACAGIAAGCAFLTKTAALPLAVTVPTIFLIRRQYARAFAFISVLLPVILAWTVWAGTHRMHSSDPVLFYYTDYFGFYKFNVHWSEIPLVIVYNLRFFVLALCGVGPWVPQQLAVVLPISAGLCIVGTTRLLIKGAYVHMGLFAIGYTVELLGWNFPPNLRFLYPLLPLAAAGFVYELLHLVDLVRRSLPQEWSRAVYIPASLALCYMVVGAFPTSPWGASRVIFQQLKKYRQTSADRRAAYKWIQEQLPTNATFAVYDDMSLYLYTGRRGVRNEVMTRPYHLRYDVNKIHRPVAEIAEFARNHQLAYLLWSEDDYAIDAFLSDTSLRERLIKHNHGLRPIYSHGGVRIYAVESRRIDKPSS